MHHRPYKWCINGMVCIALVDTAVGASKVLLSCSRWYIDCTLCTYSSLPQVEIEEAQVLSVVGGDGLKVW